MAELMDVFAIRERLGKKSPWLLLDMAEKNDETHFTGFKCVSVNEKYFIGHFPSHPIMPGVLQLEAIRQLSLCFLAGRADEWRIASLSKVKFRKPVLPGDRMLVAAEVTAAAENSTVVTVKASVSTASGVCCEALMSFDRNVSAAPVTAFPAVGGEFERSEDNVMNTDQVMKLMPHRFPFLLIDYIAKSDGAKVLAVKNVTGNELFFDAGFTTLPEVLLCEISAQAGCANVLSRPENAGKLGFFMSIDSAVFHRQIRPGEQLLVDSELPPPKSRFGRGHAVIRVGEEVVFEVTLMFALVEA